MKQNIDPRASKFAIQIILSGTCTILVGMELYKRLHGKKPENADESAIPFTFFKNKKDD